MLGSTYYAQNYASIMWTALNVNDVTIRAAIVAHSKRRTRFTLRRPLSERVGSGDETSSIVSCPDPPRKLGYESLLRFSVLGAVYTEIRKSPRHAIPL